jgi:hypothetical protein
MGQVIVVPNFVTITRPLIFLAGPIQGTADWQSEAISIIQGLTPDVDIATPRSPPPWHGDFEKQTRWEHHHLDQAVRKGCVMFWLAKEAEHICARAFAQTSRFELGWIMQRHLSEHASLVVGFEPGFSNERYLRLTLRTRAPRVPLCETLAETCTTAIALCRR